MSAIVLENLTKKYKAPDNSAVEKVALKSLNLNVEKGSIFGLLGPNGAGKSTLINILAGTVIKSSGKAYIMGVDIDSNPQLARKKIGVVPQEIALDTFFPIRQALEFYAGYYGIRPKDRKTDEIINALGLSDKANSTPRHLSGGMKRRFLVAKAMVHSPEVLVLDEPTAGVDLELREQLWEYVMHLRDQGTTIILTTHYLEEAEKLCDKIAFINHGELIKCDTKKNLLNEFAAKEVIITFKNNITDIPELLKKFDTHIHSSNSIIIDYSSIHTKLNDIIGALASLNEDFTINEISSKQTNVENVFRKLINSK